MIIGYHGSTKDARILARSGDSMRIAMENCDDAIQLNRIDGNWFSEEAKPISFEFLWASEVPLLFPEHCVNLPASSLL